MNFTTSVRDILSPQCVAVQENNTLTNLPVTLIETDIDITITVATVKCRLVFDSSMLKSVFNGEVSVSTCFGQATILSCEVVSGNNYVVSGIVDPSIVNVDAGAATPQATPNAPRDSFTLPFSSFAPHTPITVSLHYIQAMKYSTDGYCHLSVPLRHSSPYTSPLCNIRVRLCMSSANCIWKSDTHTFTVTSQQNNICTAECFNASTATNLELSYSMNDISCCGTCWALPESKDAGHFAMFLTPPKFYSQPAFARHVVYLIFYSDMTSCDYLSGVLAGSIR